MNPLEVNPETGFLESRTLHDLNVFDSYKKKQALEIALEAIQKKKFPSINNICNSIGITARSFDTHLRRDPVFREAWEEVKKRLKDSLEESNYIRAMSKMGTISNLAHLKYLENGTWNEKNVLNITNDNAKLKHILEAEIIQEIPTETGNIVDNQQHT